MRLNPEVVRFVYKNVKGVVDWSSGTRSEAVYDSLRAIVAELPEGDDPIDVELDSGLHKLIVKFEEVSEKASRAKLKEYLGEGKGFVLDLVAEKIDLDDFLDPESGAVNRAELLRKLHYTNFDIKVGGSDWVDIVDGETLQYYISVSVRTLDGDCAWITSDPLDITIDEIIERLKENW